MAVELWIGKDFDTQQERDAIQSLMNELEIRFGYEEDIYIVIADYYILGRQVDLTVLKKDAIIVIELKECNAPFTATENGNWNTANGRTVGSNDFNPYQQLQGYRRKWKEFLESNKSKFRCLSNAKTPKPFWHVNGVVAISPTLHPDTKDNFFDNIWWADLCGLDQLGELIKNKTTKWYEFSNEELRYIAKDLLQLQGPIGLNQHTAISQNPSQVEIAGPKSKTKIIAGALAIVAIVAIAIFIIPRSGDKIVASQTKSSGAVVCDCSSNKYNCPDFKSQTDAQACFEYCMEQGKGDIHFLDGNKDGKVCVSLN